MKLKYNIYLCLCIALLIGGMQSCVKDHSTGIVSPLPEVVVTGLAESYTVYTQKDTLRIHPSVQGEERYNYYWTAFSTDFVQGTAPKPDTLARTMDLAYQVSLEPGSYLLVLNVEEKKTGVTTLIELPLTVSTLNMNGWYFLKDKAGKTDFDFVYPTGRIDDWIAFYNDGEALEGSAKKAVFTPLMKTALNSTDLFAALSVITDRSAAIYRIDNGKTVFNYEDMFFSQPSVKAPQNIFQPAGTSFLTLQNDGRAYSLTKGAKFANLPNSYKLSSISCSAAMDILFDEHSRSVVLINGANYAALPASGNALKNMDADILWMSGYTGIRSVAMLLFKKDNGSGLLVKLDAQYGTLAGYTPTLITAMDSLPATHGLLSASAIGGDYDADYIFYAKGSQLYMTDIATAQENLQLSLPAGEAITCIQHIKYPQPTMAGLHYTMDKLAVASYKDGHYKVWLYTISSTGRVTGHDQPDFEGEGRVANITYLENGNGSRSF